MPNFKYLKNFWLNTQVQIKKMFMCFFLTTKAKPNSITPKYFKYDYEKFTQAELHKSDHQYLILRQIILSKTDQNALTLKTKILYGTNLVLEATSPCLNYLHCFLLCHEKCWFSIETVTL